LATATYSAIVGAGGTATVSVRTNTSFETWTVAQISIELEGAPSGAVANLRKNTYLITPMIPAGDVAAGEPYVRLLPTDVLTVEWENCTPGQIGKVLVFYEVAKP
jgi:hypothetical protein